MLIRYILSFLVTCVFYILIVLGYLYIAKPLPNNEKFVCLPPQKIDFVIVESKISSTKHKAIMKKVPTIQKKQKQKINKQVKVIRKTTISKKVVPKLVKVVPQSSKSLELNNTVIPQNIDNIEDKNRYYNKIKALINTNKIYPKKALKRRLQGSVKIKFVISPQGKLINIDIINGKKIFYKSAIKAVENSFPMNIQDNLFDKNIELELELLYLLK